MIVWRGKSLLDGKTPIVVILTGIDAATHNEKTGDMIQSWILVDDVHPTAAVRTGRDVAICGDCKHRGDGQGGKRTCYVALATGLNQVGRRLMGETSAATYRVVTLSTARELMRGRNVRIGTYGDPAAVPAKVWRELLRHAATWTGYTHQWRSYAAGRSFLMASVDSPAERTEAAACGWRTFRVRSVDRLDGVESLGNGEIVCPASSEGGRKVTCESCRLCQGAAKLARDVAIVDHSVQARAALKALDRRQLAMVYA